MLDSALMIKTDVADEFPDKTVYGVDLYPPPHKFVPPNCIFELDDVSKVDVPLAPFRATSS